MGPAADMGPLGHPTVGPEQGGADQIRGRLDGQEPHAATRQGRSDSANRSHRPAQAGPSAVTVIRRLSSSPGSTAERQGQGPVTQDGLGGVAPLDEGHAAVLDHLTESEVGDLGQVVEAVDVGVEQRPDPHRVRRPRRTGGPG